MVVVVVVVVVVGSKFHFSSRDFGRFYSLLNERDMVSIYEPVSLAVSAGGGCVVLQY